MSGFSKGAGSIRKRGEWKRKKYAEEKQKECEKKKYSRDYLKSNQYLTWLFDFTKKKGKFSIPDAYIERVDDDTTINLPMIPSFLRMLNTMCEEDREICEFELEYNGEIIYLSSEGFGGGSSITLTSEKPSNNLKNLKSIKLD